MFRKLIIKGCCVTMVACMCVSTALAVAPIKYDQLSNTDVSDKRIETEWVYANIDGLLHKRQWNITYGYWMTDWIPVPSEA